LITHISKAQNKSEKSHTGKKRGRPSKTVAGQEDGGAPIACATSQGESNVVNTQGLLQ
jgi:hypothetical protein